jgi:phosphocarrier protein HPr
MVAEARVRTDVEAPKDRREPMPQRIVTVASRVGLHARPAAVFVKAAGGAGVPVTIAKEGKEPVSARSILAVLGLDVRGGEQVTLEAEGDGANAALDELEALLGSDLEG